MAMFTQVSADTSYAFLLVALFVMGLGMGGTMMPIMTSALQTLKDHEIAAAPRCDDALSRLASLRSAVSVALMGRPCASGRDIGRSARATGGARATQRPSRCVVRLSSHGDLALPMEGLPWGAPDILHPLVNRRA
jgi:hypothetical protein